MIIGRVKELSYLNQFFQERENKIIILYGKEGSGKTTLIKEFTKDKEVFVFDAKEVSDRQQRFFWNQQLNSTSVYREEEPSSYSELVERTCQSFKGKGILVIEEFQNLVKSSEDWFEALLQIKQDWMVLLCSSLVEFVENSLVDKMGQNAAYISGFLKLKEFSFLEIRRLFPEFRIEKVLELYAVLGGNIYYWNQMDPMLTASANICKKILKKDGMLFLEGERYIRLNLREHGVYNTILYALATGYYKLNDLYQYTGYSRAKISVYLKNLMELEVVEKVYSYDTPGVEQTQKGIYQIRNRFLLFYYKYLFSNHYLLEQYNSKEYYEWMIQPTFRKFVEPVFIQICKEYLENKIKSDLGINGFGKIGTWVGKVGNIDIISKNDDDQYLVGYCSYEKQMMSYEDYEWFLYCVKQAKIEPMRIYLCSVASFDEKITLEARMKKNIVLVSMNEFE